MAIDVAANTHHAGNQWLPNSMSMWNDHNAGDGVKLGNVDEPQVVAWSGAFFDGISVKHPDETLFKLMRAMGSAHGDLSVAFCEDDVESDECDQVDFTLGELPMLPKFTSPEKIMSFNGDGAYSIMGCGMSHALTVRACLTDADCLEYTKCSGGACL